MPLFKTNKIPASRPLSFENLMERREKLIRNEVIFFVHLPRSGGNTVTQLFNRNNVRMVDLGPNNDFFHLINKKSWFDYFDWSGVHLKYLFTGHYRLDHRVFSELWMPHSVITQLRDPIDRLLSYYNFSVLSPSGPWHEEMSSGEVSFSDYAKRLFRGAWEQYRYFDDTGGGGGLEPGKLGVKECLDNLLYKKVGLYGIAERFDEFQILLAYLFGFQLVPLDRNHNVTREIYTSPDKPPYKESLTVEERDFCENEMQDDIWFYNEAVAEYIRRLDDPRLQIPLSAMPLLQETKRTLNEIAPHFPDI